MLEKSNNNNNNKMNQHKINKQINKIHKKALSVIAPVNYFFLIDFL